MLTRTPESPTTLAQLVESRVLAGTYGRIRDLNVAEIQGLVVVEGRAPSHHIRQQALQAALEILSGDQVCARIVVA